MREEGERELAPLGPFFLSAWSFTMSSRRSLSRILSLLFLVLLQTTPSAANDRGNSVPRVPGSFGARIEALERVESRLLASLEREYAAASNQTEVRRIHHQIDLVKRSAELRLFELQLEVARRRDGHEGPTELRVIVENLRLEIEDRALRYGLEVPQLELSEATDEEETKP